MFRQFIIGSAIALSLPAAAQASTEIATTARGLFSNVRVVGQPLTLVGPIASVSGRTSPGYNLAGGVASLSSAVGLGNVSGVTATLGINSGAIATAASADGTTPADTTSGSGSAQLNNLAITLFTNNGGSNTNILSLTANQVQSQTGISTAGQIASLSGQSIFTTLNLTIDGNAILSLGSNAQVAPNFVAYNSGGLKVTLNQQSVSLFDNTRLLVTNAIGIGLTNYLLDGRTVSGDILIGQSIVEYGGSDPVPEPATWAQMLAGFGTLGLAMRQRRAFSLQADPAG